MSVKEKEREEEHNNLLVGIVELLGTLRSFTRLIQFKLGNSYSILLKTFLVNLLVEDPWKIAVFTID